MTEEIATAIEDVQNEEVRFKAAVQKRSFQRMREEVEQSNIVETPRKSRKKVSKEDFYYNKIEENGIVEVYPPKPKKTETPSYLPCDNSFNKLAVLSSLKLCFDSIVDHKPENEKEDYIKRVYLDIIAKHVEKSWIFSKERMEMYSEQDYITKFWSSIFETYLGRDRDLLLNWGEKMSPKCKSNGLDFKFDLRIMVAREGEFQDIGLGEAAKRPTNSKYYNDRVKGAIAAKIYLNDFIKQVPFIDHTAIPKVQIPFVQIMGLDATLTVLSLSKKKEYTFKEVAELSYPRSLKQIKDGSIQNIMKSLIVLEQLIENLKSIYKDGQIDNSNQMARMKRGQSKKPKFEANTWITDVVWSKEDSEAVNGEEEEEE